MIRLLLALVVLLVVTGCGKQRTTSSVFTSAKPECLNETVPGRFTVKFFDGKRQTVHAASKQEFLDGFLTENLDRIEYAEHDFYVHSSVESAANVTASGGFANNWGPIRIDAAALWAQGYRGQGVIVAIVDSGMDLSHIQLKDQIAVNPGEVGIDQNGADKSTNGVDDDGNGLVDDAKGYDFAQRRPLQGDYAYHGTHVAGIVAAAHSDTSAHSGGYVQGVAPSAKLLPLAFLQGNSGVISDGIDAIEYAVQRGARVINASWGGEDCSIALRETIASLYAKGVMFVAASGNESYNIERQPIYPAAFNLPAQLTVGSVGMGDHMSQFSNYGIPSVHIFAPGGDIISTYPGDKMASLSGTSMASPMAAGAVALLWSAEPRASIEQIRRALYDVATKRAEYINVTQGRLLLTGALENLRSQIANASR